MSRHASYAWSLAVLIGIARAQQQCYFGPGAEFRGPQNLVPCNPTGDSACCLLGDTCLSGNACYNNEYGNTYQYGCTDINYSDESICPFKCGLDPTKSPWTAIIPCAGTDDTWVCHDPDSCGCEWNYPTLGMLALEPRSCQAMGNEAIVALQAPSQLPPYVSLPATFGGSTGYYSFFETSGTSTWMSTAVSGYTPSELTQFTTYTDLPTTKIFVDENASPDGNTYKPASYLGGSLPQFVPENYPTSAPAGVTASLGALPTSSSDSSSTSASPGGTTSTTARMTSTTSSTSSPSSGMQMGPGSGSSGLSTGAKAGIGVGVAVGAIVIAGLIIAIIVMRRRHKRQLEGPAQGPGFDFPPQDEKSPFMDGKDEGTFTGGFSHKKANDAAWIPPTPTELPAISLPGSELPADDSAQVHEMDAGTPELSAKPSVKGSPRIVSREGTGRAHINSVGSAFREEGIS